MVSGKGLSGWTTDPGGDQAVDYRIGWGAIGQNDSFPNWITSDNFAELTGGTPQIVEPSDAGGYFFPDQGFGP
jgi:hypothetical protein